MLRLRDSGERGSKPRSPNPRVIELLRQHEHGSRPRFVGSDYLRVRDDA